MTSAEEHEMHRLARLLAKLTEGTGWEALRYAAVGECVTEIVTYCAPTVTLSERRTGCHCGAGPCMGQALLRPAYVCVRMVGERVLKR